ncbi:hypothetical protein HYE54_05375 [Aggregatibacter actinomycetemcomitans]|uniref:Uncharacterized protein n=2 Tax=Aggregatibacter actinomycetemcomitans TaxID=714 RepID=A0A142G0H6_AGGAC|nr:hypothetical protein [Aggregatibacter actinomycetemcomitans]AFI87046.1 hypothetical protein D7S_01273 [Aggregatibacter actinomycetemcomitans D7S-1]AMQ94156.1 hypothetical protein ACT75_06230 [Aggregatibacter actinomycetemcomitans]EKX97239.1 hypothetical protein HMPREF9996_00949 [Aggregatibacter actinomycetemcomitans Y4]KND82604.1 hypothetical protein H5P1_0210970 [Aggregatibacter actinomycetemcomitans serotype a str. H5P1]KOE31711.1 hypothetical protein D17P3_0303090 [Aggregatibacter actino
MEKSLEKHFYRSSSVKTNAWLILFSGLLFIFLGFSISSIHFFFGILNLILGILLVRSIDKPVISLMNSYIEIKLTPLSATKYIKYSDIKSIENQVDRKLIFHLENNQKISFPVNLVQKDSRNELIEQSMSMKNHSKEEQLSGIQN